jgi:hypothetical protein
LRPIEGNRLPPAANVDLEHPPMTCARNGACRGGQDSRDLHAVEPAEGAMRAPSETPRRGYTCLTLTMRPGDYTLFCSLPEHEAKGMKATILVR